MDKNVIFVVRITINSTSNDTGHLLYGGVIINVIVFIMASLNQLVSEFAHSLRQPNNHALRENIKLLIIHTRNEVIRRSYEKHLYVDKVLSQRFRVSLKSVVDGDINFELPEGISLPNIKRTVQQVPRPVRLTNNLPFDRVSTAGYASNREFPFIRETRARFRGSVPGLCGMPCYDYINGYIYLFPADGKLLDLGAIIIESSLEHPNPIDLENGITTEDELIMDDNEWLLSEDMIGQIKDIIYKRDLLTTIRESNEVPDTIKI